MRRLTAICLLAAASSAFSQVSPFPTKGLGTWASSDGESLDIAATSSRLKLTINSLQLEANLDGSDTFLPAGAKLTFQRIDDLTFNVTLRVNNKALGNQVETIHYVLSADGNSLRETRTHTSRVFQRLLFIPPAGRVLLRPIEH